MLMRFVDREFKKVGHLLRNVVNFTIPRDVCNSRRGNRSSDSLKSRLKSTSMYELSKMRFISM